MKIHVVNKGKHALPEHKTIGSAGVDLKANLEEAITLQPGERTLVKTGLFIAIPIGYEAQVRPRSGLAYKHGVTVLNTPGTHRCRLPRGSRRHLIITARSHS